MYRVHDLMHDIILTRADELTFCQTFSASKSNHEGMTHRLSIHGTTENILERVGDSKLRSIYLFDISEYTKSFLIDLFENFRLLKVLDFTDAPLHNLPKEVGNLFHLKYLCLAGTKVKVLLKSIGRLRSLQALNVSNTLVRELPIETNKLRNLRHLSAGSFLKKIQYSLDTYCGVRVCEGIGRGFTNTTGSGSLPWKGSFSGRAPEADEIKMFGHFKSDRENGEGFGSFC